MLGEQFRNTYHFGADGQLVNNAVKQGPLETSQGMLLPPQAGTGRNDDPLVPEATRRAAVESAYKMGKDDYRNSHKLTLRGRGQSDAVIEKERKRGVDAVMQTGIPTHVMQDERLNHPNVVTSTEPPRGAGSRYSGGYYQHGTAFTRAEKRLVQTKSVEKIATAGGDLIPNPKPLDPMNHRIYGYTANEFEMDPDDFDPDDRQDQHYLQEIAERPEGVELRHLYRGGVKGRGVPEPTSRYFPEKAVSGYSYSDDYDRDYYVKRKPTAWEEREVVKTERKPVVPQTTLVHEIGHGYHLKGSPDDLGDVGGDVHAGRRRVADPLNEGVADGFADRYSRHKDHFAEAIAPGNPERQDQIEATGYSTGYSGWRSNTERALYAAMRQHVTETGKAPSGTFRRDTMEGISRAEGMRGREARYAAADTEAPEAASMALGRLMHENPGLHQVFHGEQFSGLGKAARASAAEYAKRIAGPSQGTQQEMFPGQGADPEVDRLFR